MSGCGLHDPVRVSCCLLSLSVCPAFCLLSRASVGRDFQEEFCDMLLLQMLCSATRASRDKDRVRMGKDVTLGLPNKDISRVTAFLNKETHEISKQRNTKPFRRI